MSQPTGGVLEGFYQGSASGMKMSKGQIGRRLLGLAVAGVALAASGAAFAELGQPAPWEYRLQEAGSPVMEQHHLVPQLAAVDHHHHHAVRAGAA